MRMTDFFAAIVCTLYAFHVVFTHQTISLDTCSITLRQTAIFCLKIEIISNHHFWQEN